MHKRKASGQAAAAGQAAQNAGQTAQAAGNAAQQAANQPVNIQVIQAPAIAPIKPPARPKFKGPGKRPRILEWVHLAGQFLKSAGLDQVEMGV